MSILVQESAPSSAKPASLAPSMWEAVQAAACAALRQAPYESVRRVDCEVCDGAIVLRGNVGSFYLKQVAQTVVARRLNGAALIVNRLEVSTR